VNTGNGARTGERLTDVHKIRSTRLFITIIKIALELSVFAFASYLAFALRFAGRIPRAELSVWRQFLPLILVLRVACMYATTRYHLAWRRVEVPDLVVVARATTLGSLALWVTTYALVVRYPRGVLILDWFITVNLSVALRMGARFADKAWRVWRARSEDGATPPKRVLIIGAGNTGQRVVRSMHDDPGAGLKAVGFADDNRSQWTARILGVDVLGPISDLANMVRRQRAEQVLVAIPSLPASRLREIVALVESTPAQLTIMPSLPQMIGGQTATRLIRNIRVEDLLERSPVRVNMESISDYLTGQCVLVTGAGGSIGSELCRQIVSFNPSKLVLLGQGENSVFWMEHELRCDLGFQAVPVIADIKDRVKLETVFREHRPTVVFHAAAHKHVPLMELNPEEAIKNNIFGTRNLAELALEYDTRRFVMISTDKAVNPTSVMGTSKRIAEMVVQSLAQRVDAMRNGDDAAAMRHLNSIHCENPVTRFAAVRFGNVLGSRGSVIPTMQRQIEKGGPVTVTHPDMVRFFMTIPEAVQLVIQAGSMTENGEVFVLDMGKPVRIMDLARNLIRLSGFTPDKDIPIKVTGMRPGEKLYEEVLTAEEGVSVTGHEKIFVARPARIDHAALHEALQRLEFLAQRGDAASIRECLRQTVPSYVPTPRPRPAEHNSARINVDAERRDLRR
jgi:FlaA1/EpsC-like NDP-sugar epimerase